jgi:hypothetical protein
MNNLKMFINVPFLSQLLNFQTKSQRRYRYIFFKHGLLYSCSQSWVGC